MPGGRLPRRETELVILRVATLAGNDYELTQHRRLGRRAGLSADEIDRVGRGAGRGGLGGRASGCCCGSPTSCTLGRTSRTPPGPTCGRSYDERECIELVMLVGHYTMLATTLTTLRVQPDRPR